MRTLDSCPDLRGTAMDTLCSLVFQLGKQYSTFIPTVHKVCLAAYIIAKWIKWPFSMTKYLSSSLTCNLCVQKLKVIVRHRIQHQRYDILITKIVKVSILIWKISGLLVKVIAAHFSLEKLFALNWNKNLLWWYWWLESFTVLRLTYA